MILPPLCISAALLSFRGGSDKDPLSGRRMSEITIGKFQVIETLGTGAHSTILHIRRSTDSTHYALKVVPIDGPEELKYLEQAKYEFRVAQMLDHPNLIKIYAMETPKDWLFRIRKVHLLLEYVNGKTLDTMPRIPMPQLVQLFERVAAGLVHMHRRGVYHGDVKPNNVLLSRTGDVKIIDYGLAWIKGENKGRVQGTPEFMAPESVKHGLVNESTDIYNFGATMYRLVAWRNPPPTMSQGNGIALDSKTWHRLLKPAQECNAEAPAALCEVIHRCLSYNAPQRPERISEVQGALDHLADELVKSPQDKLEMIEFQDAKPSLE
jgi:serine/threonine protein kinase